MAKLTFILGLSGSGKTYLSERLKKETGAEVFTNLLADDSGLTSLIAFLRDGKDCIVDEVRFCLPAYREQILQSLSQITSLDMRWICYENDLETANWNVIHRTNKGDPEGHLDLNLRLHPHYTYPANAEIVPIQRI
jgi:deoxyadenosine/deoxycytidine kinase